MARPNVLSINKAEQLEALVTPVRNQIHLQMEMLGKCTIGELASAMDREPESLYYHIHRLQRVGIIIQTGERRVGGRAEAVYALAGKRIQIDRKQSSPRFLSALERGIRTLLRFAERNLVASLGSKQTNRGGVRRNFRIEQQVVKLSPSGLADLQGRLDEMNEFLIEANHVENEVSCVITVAVSPVSPTRKGKREA